MANGDSLSQPQEELYALANDSESMDNPGQNYMSLTLETLDRSGAYTTASSSPHRTSEAVESEVQETAVVGDDGYLTVVQDSPSLEYEVVRMEIDTP